jgi:hypothetical protein
MKKILLVLMVLVLLTGCKKENNDNTNEIKEPEVKETVRYYYFENNTEIDPEDPSKKVTEIKELYLLEDKTYWFVSGTDCRETAYGTYEEDENSLTLNEQRTYGCNECYYEMEFITSFTKSGDNLITGNMTFELKNEEVDMNKVIKNYDKNCALN